MIKPQASTSPSDSTPVCPGVQPQRSWLTVLCPESCTRGHGGPFSPVTPCCSEWPGWLSPSLSLGALATTVRGSAISR